MPLPKPNAGESEDDFISRCMGNETMKQDYPDSDQRLAVCYSQWGEKSNTPERETRVFRVGVEERVDHPPILAGYAAVFNEWADLGWFQERIMPGAFNDTIPVADVRALLNHDPNFILGRTTNGTLRLAEDNHGLAVEIEPPDTSSARDIMTLVKRGDISQMSFAFRVLKEEWDESDKRMPKRSILQTELFDVSLVTYPAYPQTSIALRSYEQHRKVEKHWSVGLLRRKLRLKGGS